jgi:hypothetical protein
VRAHARARFGIDHTGRAYERLYARLTGFPEDEPGAPEADGRVAVGP